MAAPKKATHEVVHGNLMLSVGGKLQKTPKGTQLALSDVQAKGLVRRNFVVGLRDKKSVDLSGKAEESKAGE